MRKKGGSDAVWLRRPAVTHRLLLDEKDAEKAVAWPSQMSRAQRKALWRPGEVLTCAGMTGVGERCNCAPTSSGQRYHAAPSHPSPRPDHPVALGEALWGTAANPPATAKFSLRRHKVAQLRAIRHGVNHRGSSLGDSHEGGGSDDGGEERHSRARRDWVLRKGQKEGRAGRSRLCTEGTDCWREGPALSFQDNVRVSKTTGGGFSNCGQEALLSSWQQGSFMRLSGQAAGCLRGNRGRAAA